jgi:hypothetical protein
MAQNGSQQCNGDKGMKASIRTELLLQRLYGIYKDLTPTGTLVEYAEWRKWYISLLPEEEAA